MFELLNLVEVVAREVRIGVEIVVLIDQGDEVVQCSDHRDRRKAIDAQHCIIDIPLKKGGAKDDVRGNHVNEGLAQ